MHHQDHGPRHCPALPRPRLQMVWTPHQDHLGPRPTFHIPLWPKHSTETPDQSEPVNGLPPPNRWHLRTKESVGGAIPPFINVGCTRKLDTLASSGLRSTQQPKK